MRDSIFISHATPEDNDFTIWIASRLEMAGYKVWIDKSELLGGEKFWKEIDFVIRNNANKVLLVYSKHICYEKQPGNLKDGINDELELSKSVGKREHLKDFIIPLNIDNSDYDLFVGANTLSHISFFNNWSDGFKVLLNKLEKDNIKKQNKNRVSSLNDWFKNEYTTKNGIITTKELYYSNWWAIGKLPDVFYLYHFNNSKQAAVVLKHNSNIPLGKISNLISTFEPNLFLSITHEEENIIINPEKVYKVELSKVLYGFESDKFPTHKETENHFKRLMQEVFHFLMKERGLFWYKLANKKLAYFHTPKSHNKPIKFNYPYRKEAKVKKKSLLGKHLSNNWHYAISANPVLYPFIGFILKSHLIFTENGFKILDDNKKQHSARRKKGHNFWNEEWRDMELAFLFGLRDSHDEIRIPLSKNFSLLMPHFPEMFWADFGYIEPHSKERIDVLAYYKYDLMEDDEDIEGYE